MLERVGERGLTQRTDDGQHQCAVRRHHLLARLQQLPHLLLALAHELRQVGEQLDGQLGLEQRENLEQLIAHRWPARPGVAQRSQDTPHASRRLKRQTLDQGGGGGQVRRRVLKEGLRGWYHALERSAGELFHELRRHDF